MASPKTLSAGLLGISALLLAAFSSADLEAHRKWMDDAQDRKDDVREALAAKDSVKLRAGATTLEALTARESAFWARSSLQQAKDLATKNHAEAQDLLRAARNSRFEDAEKALAQLEKTCSACHDLHFEKHPSMEPRRK